MRFTLANLENYLDSINFKDEKLQNQTPVFNKSKVFMHLYVNVRMLDVYSPVKFQIIVQAPTSTGDYYTIQREIEFKYLCIWNNSGSLKRNLNDVFSSMMADAARKMAMDLITENKI